MNLLFCLGIAGKTKKKGHLTSLFQEATLTTHTPLIKGLEVHPPELRRWGSKKTL